MRHSRSKRPDVRGIGLAALLLAALCAATSVHARVYAANFDIKLQIGDARNEIRHRARVRDGSFIPIEFQRSRVNLFVESTGGRTYRAELFVLHNDGKTTYRLNEDPLVIDGEFGAPVEFRWVDGDVALDIALVVSPTES